MIVSISGMDQDTYQINHVGGKLEYVFANLEKALQIIDAYELNTKIRLRFFNMEHNGHHIELAREYAQRTGIEFELLEGAADPATSKDHLFTNEYFIKESHGSPDLAAPEESGKVCPLMFDVVAIDASSDIYLCDAMPYHPVFRIGKYLDLSEDQLLLKRYGHSFCRVCNFPRRDATDSDTQRLVRAVEVRTGRFSHSASDRSYTADGAKDDDGPQRSIALDTNAARTPQIAENLSAISDLDTLYGSEDHDRYFQIGYDAFRICQKASGKWGPRRVVDFGVGYGRVARWFRQEWPDAITYGVDINKNALAFVHQAFGVLPIPTYPQIDGAVLPGDIDLVFCGSLLTGLDAWQWDAFFRLVVPSLGPSGVLVVTTHGRAASQMLRDNPRQFGESIDGEKLLETYVRQGFAFAPYAADHPTFGVSLSSPGWVMEKLQRIPELKIISFEEQGWGQDVIVLKRNPWPMSVEREMPGSADPRYSPGDKPVDMLPTADQQDRIEISIGGTTVRVPAGVDRETLRSVVDALTNSATQQGG